MKPDRQNFFYLTNEAFPLHVIAINPVGALTSTCTLSLSLNTAETVACENFKACACCELNAQKRYRQGIHYYTDGEYDKVS